MERRKKKVVCLILSCYILLLNISTVKAEALPDVMNGSATIADCVMSYYAMAGAAVANNEWIQTLYDGLGSSFGTIYDFAENGMLTINNDGTWQATTALTDAIENSSAYTSLGLDQVFNVSAEEAAAAGGIAASGAGTIAGAVGGLASTGLLTLAGGVTAAYWGGIAAGTLIAHLTGLYGKNVYYGLDIATSEQYLNGIPAGGGSYNYRVWGETPNYEFYTTDSGIEAVAVFSTVSSDATNEGSVYRVGFISNDNKTHYVHKYRPSTKTFQNYSVSGSATNVSRDTASYLGYYDGFKLLNNYTGQFPSVAEIKQALANGEYTQKGKQSPDLIGPEGNQIGEYDPNTGKYSVPDFKPQIDTGTQAGVPLTLNDWLNFANSVSNNNSKTDPLPDNSALFDSLMDAIVRAIPNPDPNPNPNPNPNPDPDPYTPPVVTPVPDPDYDPVPDNPDQPDYESEKQKQTEPVPDEVPTGAPWTTDGLLDKFPFCIPKDMIDMVKQFSSGSRQAPYINWRFNPPNTPVDYTFNLDLSDFEDVATLLRMLELAAFIVGLAFATRYLIGAS